MIRRRLSGLGYLLDRAAIGALLRGLGVARARRWPRPKPFVLVHQMFADDPVVDSILREAGPIPLRLFAPDAVAT